MTMRTIRNTVTFRMPFVLGEIDEVLPPGAYEVETDEELLEGISFPAYWRVSAFIHLHPKPDQPGITRTWTIDPKELDAALERDRAAVRTPAGTDTGQRTPERSARLGRQEADREAIERAEDEGMATWFLPNVTAITDDDART